MTKIKSKRDKKRVIKRQVKFKDYKKFISNWHLELKRKKLLIVLKKIKKNS